MKQERPTRLAPRAQEINTLDQGNSSAPERRCETCACFLTAIDPNNIGGNTTGVCRRNMALLQIDPRTGQPIGLSYPMTTPKLVCFDGWRPLDTPPGDRFPVGSKLEIQ